MEINRDSLTKSPATAPVDREGLVFDRETALDQSPMAAESHRGGSKFMAFLIGGLVIAIGLLAFLFYDGGSREVNTTGSTTPRIQAPATSVAPAPATPVAPTLATPTPATPR